MRIPTHSSIHKFLIIPVVSLLMFSSCAKEEGEGGLATIKGKVYTYYKDGNGTVVDSAVRSDTRVYISYGDHTWVDDDTRTSYTGEYAFQWLQKGDYKVWVLGECATCTETENTDIASVSVDEKRETVEVRILKYYVD